MKNYEKLNRKNKVWSLLFALFGVCSIISTYLFEPIGKKIVVTSMGWMATAMGILMFLIYTFGKHNKKIKDTTIAENDEMSAEVRGKAADKSFWPIYYLIVISYMVVQYVNISISNYILILICVSPAIYFVNLVRVVSKYQ